MSDTALFTSTMGTPDGLFTILADESGVLASGWTDRANLLDRIGKTGTALKPTVWEPIMVEAVAAVESFYAGEEDLLCQVPVHLEPEGFHRQVQEALRVTHIGDTVTYAELAEMAGNHSAARAAASACAKNPTTLFVPCHRAVRTDGTTGGFAYGVPIKESLLEREQRILAAGGPVRVETAYARVETTAGKPVQAKPESATPATNGE